MPSSVLGSKSPISLLPPSAVVINLAFRIFGWKCFVHIHDKQKGKLDPKALKCIIMGYSTNKKGHKCYHPNIKPFVTMDVLFMNH